jgi:hypothetical protein
MARERLIDEKGQPAFGLFAGGVAEINHMDYDLRNTMDKRLGSLARRLKFNQFQFIGLTSPQLIVGIAIIDLKFVGSCFVYAYEPNSGRFEEFSAMQPLARNTAIDLRPNDGAATFTKGGNSVLIRASATPRQRSISAALECGIQVDALIDEANSFEPLAMCARAGYDGWVFTQKTTALACPGRVDWQGDSYDLAEIGALASVDWSAGYMRRETFWNWGSLSCELPDGRRLGFNLAAGVNETGFTENGVWLDGKLHKVDMVDFRFDRYSPQSNWALRSNDGVINLNFEPAGQRTEKMNAVIAASNFTQHFGRYSGEVTVNDEVIAIDGAWGFAEDHYAKW